MKTLPPSVTFTSAINAFRNSCSTFRYFLATRNEIPVHQNDLYTEAMFRSFLIMERKRTERSHRPFLLVRIDVSRLPRNSAGKTIEDAIANALFSVTRETDIKGWFTGGRTLGVIITDYTKNSAYAITDKIRIAVENACPAPYTSLLCMTHDIFPTEVVHGNTNTIILNTVIYNNNCFDTVSQAMIPLCKRCIDVVGSIMCMIFFSPFFIMVPVLIKVSSKGPVFFCQKRVGRFGKTFTCIKFRTMKPANDDSQHKEFIKKFIANSIAPAGNGTDTQFKIKDDPRVTSIGKFLRKTSLDELPQFFNVLLGHMSIVGPRPAIPYEVDEYDTWHRRRVVEVKPGITGIWQLQGRSRTDFNNMVRMDIKYINTWSPILDLRLIFTTPLAMISTKGAC